MQQQLENIIQNLKLDRGKMASSGRENMYAVRITDISGKTIVKSQTVKAMDEAHGSPEGFFNHLYNSGIKNFIVQPRRRNGSSWMDAGDSVKINAQPVNSNSSSQQQAAPENPYPNSGAGLMGGLNVGGLLAGLNGMDVAYRYQDYPKIVQENTELKAENKAMKEKIEQLKEEAIKKDFSETKAAGQKDLVTGLLSSLPELISAFKQHAPAAPVPGLAAPAIEDNSTLGAIVEAVSGLNENEKVFVYAVIEGMMNSQDFGNELVELANKHKILNQ